VFLFVQQLKKKTKGNNSGNENPETSKKFAVGVEVRASSEHELTSPKVNTNLLIQAYHTRILMDVITN